MTSIVDRIPNVKQFDPAIRDIIVALIEVGLETDWSCQGGPGYMTIRPTIQIRTSPCATPLLLSEQRRKINAVMQFFRIRHYWLSLVYAHGVLDSHGGEPTWLLQWPVYPGDILAMPAALTVEALKDWGDITPMPEEQIE